MKDYMITGEQDLFVIATTREVATPQHVPDVIEAFWNVKDNGQDTMTITLAAPQVLPQTTMNLIRMSAGEVIICNTKYGDGRKFERENECVRIVGAKMISVVGTYLTPPSDARIATIEVILSGILLFNQEERDEELIS